MTGHSESGAVTMTEAELDRKARELDQLLNDPNVPMLADRVWVLLADLARREAAARGMEAAAGGMSMA
jgi:hypothetical protein